MSGISGGGISGHSTNQLPDNSVLMATDRYFQLLNDPNLFAEKRSELRGLIAEFDNRKLEAEAKERACEQTIATMHAQADAQIAERKRVVEEELQLKEQKANELANQIKDAAAAYRLDIQNQMYQLSVNTQTRCVQMEREAKEKADKIIADAETIKEEAAKNWAAAKADKMKAQQLLQIAES